MIVDAVPSGAVGNIAPRCWEGRKEKVLAGVRGWTFSSLMGWRNRGLCADILFIPGMLVLSPISVTFWRTQLWLSCWNTAGPASPSFWAWGDPRVLSHQLQPKSSSVGVCWVLVPAGLGGRSCARPQEQAQVSVVCVLPAHRAVVERAHTSNPALSLIQAYERLLSRALCCLYRGVILFAVYGAC